MHFGWFGPGLGALGDADGVVPVAVELEGLGFESLWIGEHPVVIDPRVPPSPVEPSTHLLDPVVALAAVAAATSTLRLGTGILLLPLREPVVLAKQLATLDVLSAGRLLVGIGVGYVPGENEAIGVDFHTRGRRTDDAIDAMRALWHQPQPHHDGPFFRFAGVQSNPRPVAPGGPPIIASGTSTAALRRAVERCHGWYGFFQDVPATTAALDALAHLAEEVDRPAELGPLEITITPPPGPVDAATIRLYEELGVHRLVLMRDFGDMGGLPDPGRRDAVLDAIRSTASTLGLGS